MNNSFAEVDGRPALVDPGARQPRPGHRPAGQERQPLAGRGQRQGRRHDGLRPVPGRVRGHHPAGPAGQADRRRLRRHHDQPDQPGHDRHRALGAPADAGPGHDHRRRRDGVSGGVRRDERGGPRAERGQPHGHAHLDLRPPHHPGRAVRRVPQADARAAARRRRLLRRDLPRPAHPVRAGPVGAGPDLQPRGPDRQGGPRDRADQRVPHQRPPDGRHRPARVHASAATRTWTSSSTA